jgi:hypothetical protein
VPNGSHPAIRIDRLLRLDHMQADNGSILLPERRRADLLFRLAQAIPGVFVTVAGLGMANSPTSAPEHPPTTEPDAPAKKFPSSEGDS